MIKICVICKKEFEAKKSAITCSSECSKIQKYNKRKIYKEKNKDFINKQAREWFSNNKEKTSECHKKYRDANKDKIKKYRDTWYNKNKNYKFRIQNDLSFKFVFNIRQWFNRAFRHNKKSNKTFQYVDYTFEEFREHIEKQFKEGMSWDNWTNRGWHVDHIKPISKFNFFNEDGTENIEQVKECFSLNNLQPLWAKDNLSKGNRY